MKKLLVVCTAMVLGGALFAQMMDDDELKATGGMVTKPGSGMGQIVFLNSQKKVALKEIQDGFEKVTDLMHLPVVFKEGKIDGKPGTDTAKKAKADFVIAIIDDASVTAQLQLSPDEKWAVVNIAPLYKDDPTPPRLRDRVKKSAMRAFGWLCGCVNASYQNSVMAPMRTMVDMDRVKTHELPIDSYNRVLDYLYGFRVTPYVIRTYKTACKEGWAAQPTNDYQKAIWEQMNAAKERGPANGIKIPAPAPKTAK